MREIIPFKKTISFNTYIDEVTSISLDDVVNTIDKDEITGYFNLYLEYKENDVSVNILNYKDKIPFTVNLNSKYKLDNVKVSIDDFYYEIDDKSINLYIDLLLDNLIINDDDLKDLIRKKDDILDKIDIIENKTTERKDDKVEDLFYEEDLNLPLFETFNEMKDDFITYKVHIVKEDDTIVSICNKYNITKEDLYDYNDIKELIINDKLIVPSYKK